MGSKRRKFRPMKVSCRRATMEEAEAGGAARSAGLRLTVKEFRVGKVISMHWMFDDVRSGRRVVDYWPGSGTWIGMGTRGVADNPSDMLGAICAKLRRTTKSSS